jgi:hypothetical protein
MSLTAKTLLALTVAVSAAAAVATLASLPSLAERFRLTWGWGDYLWVALPYALLMILAIVFRQTDAGAGISLIGALLIGGLGVFAMYNTLDAMGVGFIPLYLFACCGLVLLAQLVRWVRMRHTHRE